MGDYYGIMAKTVPQDAGETDAQAAGSPVADAQPPAPAVEGCQIQLVCQCENCRFWKAGNTCREEKFFEVSSDVYSCLQICVILKPNFKRTHFFKIFQGRSCGNIKTNLEYPQNIPRT